MSVRSRDDELELFKMLNNHKLKMGEGDELFIKFKQNSILQPDGNLKVLVIITKR